MTAYDLRISDWSSDVCSSDLDLSRATGRGGIVADMLDAGEPLQRRIVAGQARGGDVACIADVKREARAWRDVQLRPRRTEFRHPQIGRASWRERVCQEVVISEVAVSLKKKNNTLHIT